MKCFVVMKFGKTKEEQDKSKNKYKLLVEAACIDAGYLAGDVTRADIESVRGGDMDKHIIQSLAKAELVIVDITGANPNVYYELGIRHTLKKRGTLIIKSSDESIPFDIAKQYIHSYDFSIDTLTQDVDNLSSLIKERRSNEIDTPVHEWLSLPPDVVAISADNSDKIIDDLKKRIAELENNNLDLIAKMSKITEDDADKSKVLSDDSIVIDFQSAERFMHNSGTAIIQRLTTCLAENSIDKFKQEIILLQENVEYVDWDDFRIIADLCEKMKLIPYQIAILEYANKKYSSNDKILVDLIDAYNGSPSLNDKKKAIALLEKHFSICCDKQGMPKFKENFDKLSTLTESELATIFNTYIHHNNYEMLLSITLSAQADLGLDLPIIKRNLATSYRMLGRNEEAIEISREIVHEIPTAQEFMKLSEAFFGQQKYEIGYRLRELAAVADPEDEDALLSLAIAIFNKQYARTEGGIEKIKRGQAIKHMTPLVLRAIEISPTEETIAKALRFLLQAGGKKESDMIMTKIAESDFSLVDSLDNQQYSLAALNYILEKIDSDYDIDIEIDLALEL